MSMPFSTRSLIDGRWVRVTNSSTPLSPFLSMLHPFESMWARMVELNLQSTLRTSGSLALIRFI